MSSKHARLSASSAERWMNCPGSVKLTAGKGTVSFAAAEGTYAHALAAQCIGGGDPAASLGQTANLDGHNVTCGQDMVDGVRLYLAAIAERRLEKSWVEMPLLKAMRTIDPDLGGTADYVTYSKALKLLRVMDFKYGAGTFVSVDDNKQLKTYALGALIEVNEPVETIEVVVVQPRFEGAEPVRSIQFAAFELLEFAAQLKEGAKATRKKDAPTIAGPWCKKTFCPAAATCPSLEKHQGELIAMQFGAVIDPAKLAIGLNLIPVVEERIKQIKELAYQEATKGVQIPGYKLVEKRARRFFTEPDKAVNWAESRGIEAYLPPELKSPAQLEKGLKAKEKRELEKFIGKMSTGTALVSDSDNRPAVARAVTAEDFDALPTESSNVDTDNLFE